MKAAPPVSTAQDDLAEADSAAAAADNAAAEAAPDFADDAAGVPEPQQDDSDSDLNGMARERRGASTAHCQTGCTSGASMARAQSQAAG